MQDSEIYILNRTLRLFFRLIIEAAATREPASAEILAALAGIERMGPSISEVPLEIDRLWSQGRADAWAALAPRGGLSIPLPRRCPFALDRLVARDFDPEHVAAALRRGGIIADVSRSAESF